MLHSMFVNNGRLSRAPLGKFLHKETVIWLTSVYTNRSRYAMQLAGSGLCGVHMDATWRIRLNNPCSATMQAVATVTVATFLRCSVNSVEVYTKQVISRKALLSHDLWAGKS